MQNFFNSIQNYFSPFLGKISDFFALNNRFPLRILAAVLILAAIYLLFRIRGQLKIWLAWLWRRKDIFWSLAIAIVLVGLFIGAPRLKFWYDTRLVIPAHLSEMEKKQFQGEWRKVMDNPERGKNNSALYNDIGILRAGVKDYEGAIRAFKLAIGKNPDDARFYRNLAIAYNYAEKYKDSESAFLKAFQLAPSQPEYWLELGELYTFKLKDTGAARLFYLEAINKTDANASVAQAFANFLENVEKDYPEAVKYWQIVADKVTENKAAFLAHIAELKVKAGIR